ncbi:hypothetical protein JCM10908_004688 [Rhodotorula pacifica]|uniref:sorting nexin 1 n=1 Tax=Rhodotorula pacifica TaxID=1495444 RepID=UPI0031718DEC
MCRRHHRLPPHRRPAPSARSESPKLAGFRDDDGADFGDLMNPSSSVFGTASAYSSYGGPDDDDDLASNPFADLASSSTAALPYETITQPSYASQAEPYPSALPQSPGLASPPSSLPYSPPAQDVSAYIAPPVPIVSAAETQTERFDEPRTPISPPFAHGRSYSREAAPPPETPSSAPPASAAPPAQAGDPDAFTYNPYTTSPPFASRFEAAPSSPRSSFVSDAAPSSRSKPDLSALLGDERPPVPSFKRTERSPRTEGKAGALGSKIAVLPASSVGRKPVAKPLASLLGLEVEDDAVQSSPKVTSRSEEVAPTAQNAGSSTASVTEHTPPSDAAPSAKADPISTPLPPSRSETPDLVREEEERKDVASSSTAKPPMERMVSDAPSSASVDTIGGSLPYEDLVSPLETGETPKGENGQSPEWHDNKTSPKLEDSLSNLHISAAHNEAANPFASTKAEEPSGTTSRENYSQYIFSDDHPAQPVSAESDSHGRRHSYTDGPARHSLRAPNGSGDEGGFGGASDADSVRGTYSRSVEVGETEEATHAETEAADPGTPGTDSTAGPGTDTRRTEREGSTPLPPLPPPVPNVQGSPRSTDLGGSLGPAFIITVGDPQKIGYNPATQHTVYTVRTRTTSPSYRKSDFSVLRRYSHFVWLYEALTQNNPGVIVPGMPEKHAIGRFGSDFVENRRVGLQTALNKIVAHPMLVGDPDLRLFLESDTFDIDIKQRKIEVTAENKGLLASLSSSISGPKFVEFDDFFEQRRQQLDIFEVQLRSLVEKLASANKARSGLQASIAELQSAFIALSQCDLSSSLRKLYDQAATVQQKLHDLASSQAEHDERVGSLLSVAESYARMCASAKDVFGARVKAYHTWQAAESNVRKLHTAHEKAKRSGRTHSELMSLSVAEIADDGRLRLTFDNQAERKMLDARHDFDDVSKLTKAEMARFDRDKVDDFKKALEDYADSLAERQREVVRIWQQYYDLLTAAVEANKAKTSSDPPSAAASSQPE